ncbi:uncharacterized protein Z520_02710 [Fonsecaea multimorphosa CBS 102226]|uniref:Putative transcription factor kapC n=1 Tax=Fonsecaea multimorphosa CBS 102226 TaxID=1442371 RepID=A0A0D2K5R7_9EURO|nr:uncharacterized protein Z520_02710 [Fonsecaea multimorphosa CBS 102226]KIY01158.1 hypothetical protein Z520_02710 [Fonsecaea multimorphosa CBS 102226]
MYFSDELSAQIQAQGLLGVVPAVEDLSSLEQCSGCGHDLHIVAELAWSHGENCMQVVPASQSQDQAFDAPETCPQACTWSSWEEIPLDTVFPLSAALQESSPASDKRGGSRSAVPCAQNPSDKATEELQAQAKLVSSEASTKPMGILIVDHAQFLLQERRRAQNRASQQAFRARKESHIRALEKRLEVLKAAHESILTDFTRRQAEIDQLKTRIAELGVELNLLSCTHRHCEDGPHSAVKSEFDIDYRF